MSAWAISIILRIVICYTPSSWRRMPYSQSNSIKWAMMDRIGATNPRDYELDHIIPIELGGGNNLNNLALEPIAQARIKDGYENLYHNLYCSGKISLGQAQKEVIKYE